MNIQQILRTWNCGTPMSLLALLFAASTPAQGIVPETAEPNDLRGRPMVLPLGLQGEGTLSGPTDVDVWRVPPGRSVLLEVWTGPGRVAPCEDTALEVLAMNQGLLSVNDDADRRGRHAVCRCAVPATGGYLVVRPRGPGGSYTIECRETSPSPWVSENDEPNGDPRQGGRPTVIEQEGVADGAIGFAGDADWYELILASPQNLLARAIGVLSPPLAEVALDLWSADARTQRPVWQRTVTSVMFGPAAIELLLPAGRYWLVVRADGVGTGSYQLSCRNAAVVADFGGACGRVEPLPRLQVARSADGVPMELPVFGSTFVVDGSSGESEAIVCRTVGLRMLRAPLPLPFGVPCLLTVDPVLFDFTVSDAAGRFRQALPLPRRWPFLGQPLVVQALAVSGGQLGLSNVLSLSCGHSW